MRFALDFLEVANQALTTLVGRMWGIGLSYALGCGLAAFFLLDGETGYGIALGLLFFFPIFSVFSAPGLVITLGLFLFSVGFVRYEDWPTWLLGFVVLVPMSFVMFGLGS